jgi:hypothetical protein
MARSIVIRLAGVCLVALLAVTVAFGQSTTGTIQGTVVDQSGAVVPDAKVSVKNLDTNITRTAMSGQDGRFNFPGLPVGRYEITVELAGFATLVRGPVTLVLNQTAVVTLELHPAAVAETVTVTDDIPLLNTTDPEVGVRFDQRRLQDLPTFQPAGGGFRDIFAYALSAPGVSQTNSGNSNFTTGTNFSVNGMRLRSNNFMIDGQDSNDPSVTGRQQVMNNPDIVQEFRLVTNQFSAEYGRAAGAVVNVVTKSGTNEFHGSAYWFYNSNRLNAMTNTDKAGGAPFTPFYNEHQFGGTGGGPILRDKTFFFGSLQRWTIRQLGSGTTIQGVPTEAGRQMIQALAGNRPQVQALLNHLPAAQAATGATAPLTVGTSTVQVPLGTLTNFSNISFDNWQWSSRLDHNLTNKHSINGRFLFNDSENAGSGQATPPGLTTVVPSRTMAQTVALTSNFTPRLLNELRLSWQRLSTVTTAADPRSEEIPSIEVPELGLTGFNAAASRTAIGLAVNLPQFRTNNTYQITDTVAWTRGRHAIKAGLDLRRIDVKSFFFPTIRGRLVYPTLQRFVDDVAMTATINKPLPGGVDIQYYEWDDYFFFVQDTWQIHPTFSLNAGLRYETPGNALASLYPVNANIVQVNGGSEVFRLTPRPGRDKNNFQPRLGFSWNPRVDEDSWLSFLTGGNKTVIRGGYARTNDYQFINIALNVASSFPYVASITFSGAELTGAFVNLPNAQPNFGALSPNCDGLPPLGPNCLTRTVIADNFRSPIAEQFSLEIQRQLPSNTVFRLGYVGTKGTALFQTIDGNPRTLCTPVPTTSPGCPRVDAARGVIRLRANAASSIYHSLQASMDRRFVNGLGFGAHYTWSAFIDTASEIFNPSARGEVAVAQNSFDRANDRARSTYDRPHRFAANFVYELPFQKAQQGVLGHVAGGWQVSGFVTFQSGSPWTPLNGSDPARALNGIDALVGNAIRPNLNTSLNVSKMTPEELLAAGGRALFAELVAGERFGNAGRNILRSDGIQNFDFSVMKSTMITESHRIQFRADFFNLTNTRNFGIPEARVNNVGFGNQFTTDGGSRKIYMSLKYLF